MKIITKNYSLENGNRSYLIYLTDVECCAPKTQPMKPMLWVHSSGHNINEDLPGTKIKIVR